MTIDEFAAVTPGEMLKDEFLVEWGCGAVAVGRACLFPPLSSGGALVDQPWLRFHIPLIEPDVQISRIRLSDKTSRLCLTRDAICGSRTRCGVYRLPNLQVPRYVLRLS